MTKDKGHLCHTALMLNLQKDCANVVYASWLIYILCQLYNDTEDVNFRAQDANNFAAEWAPSINDRQHIIKRPQRRRWRVWQCLRGKSRLATRRITQGRSPAVVNGIRCEFVVHVWQDEVH